MRVSVNAAIRHANAHTRTERDGGIQTGRGRSLVLWPSPLPSPAHGVRWSGCSIKSHIQLVVKGEQIHPRVRRSVRKRNQRSSDRISQPSKGNDVINTKDARALAHGRQRQYAERTPVHQCRGCTHVSIRPRRLPRTGLVCLRYTTRVC